MIDHPPGWLDDAAWALIQRQVPVTCVDLVPVRSGAGGGPLEPGLIEPGLIELGLIERESPFGVRWCQIGGRLRLGETIRAGLLRHLAHTLAGAAVQLPDDPQPDYVMQWFTEEISPERDHVGYGFDPRQHAVALCFAAEMSGEPVAVEGGEALRFGWFTVEAVRALGARLWPGTGELVEAISRRWLRPAS
jgi:ADP-ribose pyrophosphatase YjhB (NUDIX family)